MTKNTGPFLEKIPTSIGRAAKKRNRVNSTASTDRTREIAARFTSRIFDFPWRDDFAAARNKSFSHASMDYCLWLDADDVLLEEDRAAFLELKETLDPAVSVVMAPYHAGFDETGRVTFSYYRERLIKNRAGMRWEGAVHEAIAPAGRIFYAAGAAAHKSRRSPWGLRRLLPVPPPYLSPPPADIIIYGKQPGF